MSIKSRKQIKDAFTFKLMGYSRQGRALLYVPRNADIVFLDFENNGWRKVTDNFEKFIAECQTLCWPINILVIHKKFYDNIFMITKEKGGESGYYLINHSVGTGRRLGSESSWNDIARSLDGKRVTTITHPAP